MSRKCTSELRVRLSDAEYEQIQNNAARCGLTISDYVRKLLREEPLIQKPRQDAIEHFYTIQRFKTQILEIVNLMPIEKRGDLLPTLEQMLYESKQMI